ncbi:MAG: hypothetical protein WA220_11210 [Candidatus Nitrosopolaris sp.]
MRTTTAAIPYPAPQSQGQQSPTLKVVTTVNNAGVGTANASNFSQVIANAFSNPDGYTYAYHFVRGSIYNRVFLWFLRSVTTKLTLFF